MSHLVPEKSPKNWRSNSRTDLSAGFEDNQDPKLRERKNGSGNVYANPVPGTSALSRQGTLLDKWKEYTKGEDAESIINNIYTPQTSAGGDVIVAKKEQLQTEDSKQKLRILRMKAMERQKVEEGKNVFTSSTSGMAYNGDTEQLGRAVGGTYYQVTNQKQVLHMEDSDEEDDTHKRKEKWYKRAHRMFKSKHQIH